MHKVSRVHETTPSATPEGGEDRRPSIPMHEPDAAAEDRSRQPEGQIASGHPQKRAGTRWGASNEGATSSGRKKSLINHLERSEEEREDFSCRRVERTGDQQRVPGRQNSKTRHHLWTSNEWPDRAVGTRHRDRRPANWARKRQGGADARWSLRSSTKEADSPSKAEGHSRTPAPDAEATAVTLHYDRSQ